LKLIKYYKLEDTLKNANDYACFGDDFASDMYIFYSVDNEIKWQYIRNDGLEHAKKKAGLENDVFGKKIYTSSLSYHYNGYAVKLATDHKLQEKINDAHDYAQFSDGGCIYLFYKNEGEIQLDIVGIDECKIAIDQAGLKYDVLATSQI